MAGRRSSWFMAFAGMTMMASSAASPALAYPETLTDAQGRAVTLAARPERIVAIFASNVELLAALGAAPRIVGIEAYTRYPPEVLDRPQVGGRLGFSAEAIARLNPDFVVMTAARHAAHQLVRPMAVIGVPVLVLDHRDLGSILANLRLLGRAIGAEAEAEGVVAGMEARLTRAAARLGDRPRRRVYLETASSGRGGFQTVRDGTYTSDALRAAGGDSVFAGRNLLAQVSGEAVLAADPDIILVAGTEAQAAELRRRPGWDRIRAVREGRVHAVPRAELLIPGPRVIDGVERLGRILYPDLP